MSPGGKRRSLALSIGWKVGIPLLLGLVSVVAARTGGASGRSALETAAVVVLGLLLILLVIDFEFRVSSLDERTAAGFETMDEKVSTDIAKIDRNAELLRMVESSVLDTALLTDFIETAGRAGASANPLLARLARREVERATRFLRHLPVGSEIAYDGEDREWLLGLAQEAQHTIDAISLSTVDAGMRGFDGGLWTSDLGARYLELQRQAISRGASIRRIFLIESEDLARDETFLNITQMQRDVGVEVRMLDYQLIPDTLRSMIFDFIIFDGMLSYEATAATIFSTGGTRPAMVRTLLAPGADHVQTLESQFKQLWEAADPDRRISG